MNKTTFLEVSSLKIRCGSTTKIQRANARVWIGNITVSQQNKVQNATNSKKGDFLIHNDRYTSIMKTGHNNKQCSIM